MSSNDAITSAKKPHLLRLFRLSADLEAVRNAGLNPGHMQRTPNSSQLQGRIIKQQGELNDGFFDKDSALEYAKSTPRHHPNQGSHAIFLQCQEPTPHCTTLNHRQTTWLETMLQIITVFGAGKLNEHKPVANPSSHFD